MRIFTLNHRLQVLMNRLYYFLGYVLILYCSCNIRTRNIHTSHPYFDSGIVKAEKIYDGGDKMGALQFIRLFHNTANDLNIEDEMNYYSYCNTIFMKDLKDYDKCIDYADSMFLLLEKSGHLSEFVSRRIQAYNIKADALMAKGSYNEAYDNYFKAKTLAKDNSDSCSFFTYSYSLGMVSYKQQKYRQAADYFKQSYYYTTFCDGDFTYFYRRQELLDNIGLSYGHAREYDSAMIYYQKALDCIVANTNKYPNKGESVYASASAVVFGNMADIYLATGKSDTAILLLERSIAVNLQKGYTNADAQLSQLKLAGIFLETRSFVPLKKILGDIKGELDTIPSKFIEMQWFNLMSQYYGANRDTANQCRYLLPYLDMKDSFEVKNKALMTSDVEGRVRSLERQHQISLLEKDKAQQKIYLVVVIIIAIMAIIIVLLVLRHSARAATDVRKLTELNNQIGEQKAQLESALSELEQKDKDKSRILRSVAHDVMSPISAVAALTDILITEADDSNDEHKEILNLIREACNNSLNLSKDILDAAAAIAPGKIPREWVDINKLVNSCAELLNFRAHEKGQQIIFNPKHNEISAYVNRDKIWRVINNLLVNAIKFSFEKADIFIDVEKQEDNVVIAIRDTGVGIPEKNRDAIFDMFTESKTYGTLGEKPNGLGLSISLQVAKLHGGDIWYESEEGKGTTFYFSFPLQLNS